MTETLNTWAIHAMNSFKSADGTLLKVDLSVDHVVAVRSNCSGILTQRETGNFLKAITSSVPPSGKEFSDPKTVYKRMLELDVFTFTDGLWELPLSNRLSKPAFSSALPATSPFSSSPVKLKKATAAKTKVQQEVRIKVNKWLAG